MPETFISDRGFNSFTFLAWVIVDGTMANSYLVKTNGMNIIIDAGTPGSGKKNYRIS